MSGAGYERRKQVRVKMRRDLIVVAQEVRGRTHYVIKDPVRLRYFRFKEPEHFLASRFDGRQTLDEVRVAFESHYRPRRMPLDELEAFACQLMADGLAHPSPPRAPQQLLERREQFRQQARWNLVPRLLSLRVPLCDPDRHLGRLARGLRGLLSPTFLLVGSAFILAAMMLVTVHFGQFRARLPSAGEFFHFRTAIYLWAAIALAKLLHELGHALSCKVFGGEVHEAGLMLLCFAPCLYCDVSDSWTFPSKWRRVFVGFAGIYAELLIAALATFVWWHTPGNLLINRLCLSLMIVCSVNTLTLNGNPLLRYDGYYMLSDWLEIANLHDRSRHALLGVVMQGGLGIPVRGDLQTSLPRRLALASFGAMSVVYRWVVTIGMIWVLRQFLIPHRLVGLVLPLVFMVIGVGAIMGFYRVVRNAVQRGRFAEMKPFRFMLGVGAAISLAACFFLLPLPVSYIRQTGLLAFHPDAAEAVHVAVPGILARVYVREGQRVAAGDLLAEFHNGELEEEYAEEQASDALRGLTGELLQRQVGASSNLEEQTQASARAALAASEQARAVRRTGHYKQLVGRLQLRAPRAGVVIGLPDPSELGRFWALNAEKPFCTIGDPDRLWVVVPLEAADYYRIRDARDRGLATPVALVVPGCAEQRHACRIVRFPEAEADTLPRALTSPHGGPVVVHSAAGTYARPVSPQYLVAAELLDASATARPGLLVRVVFRCPWKTGAAWAWETLAGSVGAHFF